MSKYRHITRQQERVLYRVIENMKRAYNYANGEYPLDMPWGIYSDSIITLLELAFPNINGVELYNFIDQRIEETKGIECADVIISKCQQRVLWYAEERGIKCWLYCKGCWIEETFFDPVEAKITGWKKNKELKKEIASQVKTGIEIAKVGCRSAPPKPFCNSPSPSSLS